MYILKQIDKNGCLNDSQGVFVSIVQGMNCLFDGQIFSFKKKPLEGTQYFGTFN